MGQPAHRASRNAWVVDCIARPLVVDCITSSWVVHYIVDVAAYLRTEPPGTYSMNTRHSSSFCSVIAQRSTHTPPLSSSPIAPHTSGTKTMLLSHMTTSWTPIPCAGTHPSRGSEPASGACASASRRPLASAAPPVPPAPGVLSSTTSSLSFDHCSCEQQPQADTHHRLHAQ